MNKIIHKIAPAAYLILIKASKVLLLRRDGTWYEDGNYSLVAGSVESGETFTQCIIREAFEEAGILLRPENLSVACVMHRDSSTTENNERIDVFFYADAWEGDITNKEPNKCTDLSWFDIGRLPENIVPYIKYVISSVNGKPHAEYTEYGWDTDEKL